MAIKFFCACGASFEVPDELAGLRAPCPACRAALVVPAADDNELVEDVEVEDGPTPYGFADPNAPTAELPAGPADAPTGELPAAAPAGPDDEPEVVGDADPEEVAATEEEDEATPVYFVAAYSPATSLRQPKTFRVYACRKELLVLHAGPFGWAHVNLLADRPGVPDADRKKAREATALGSGMVTETEEFVRKGLARRAAVLDRMTLDELRAEATSDQLSFRVTAETVARARVEPPGHHEDEDWRAHELAVGRLKFTHAKTGKWELVLVTKADALAAVREFRRVLGEEKVDVALRLKA